MRQPILRRNPINLSRPAALQRPVPVDVVDAGRSWFRVVNHDPAQTAEVWIYDAIGWYGVTADDFARALTEITTREIVVRVNSPGGDYYDAIAIYNALLSHPATVTVQVDSLAASAASFIIQSGDRVVMGRNSQVMIHDALTLAIGNAADMRACAEFLDDVSSNIASIYADRSGGTAEAWRELMITETWFSAQEAVDAGLADEVAPAPARRGEDDTDGEPAGESVVPGGQGDVDDRLGNRVDEELLAATHDLSLYRFAGRAAAGPPPPVAGAGKPARKPEPAPVEPEAPPAAEPAADPAVEPAVEPEPAPHSPPADVPAETPPPIVIIPTVEQLLDGLRNAPPPAPPDPLDALLAALARPKEHAP